LHSRIAIPEGRGEKKMYMKAVVRMGQRGEEVSQVSSTGASKREQKKTRPGLALNE